MFSDIYNNNLSIKNKGKYLLVRRTSYFWAIWSFRVFTGPLFQIKLHLLRAVILNKTAFIKYCYTQYSYIY